MNTVLYSHHYNLSKSYVLYFKFKKNETLMNATITKYVYYYDMRMYNRLYSYSIPLTSYHSLF